MQTFNMATTETKRRTLSNNKSEILEAKVIANYGDPGLDEDYHFDILSRYVVAMIESTDRIPTEDKWFNMLVIVKRPEYLWIQTAGGITNNPATQQRSDYYGNVNTGPAASYTTNGIARMNTQYQMGETIRIRRLPTPLTQGKSALFQSAFTSFNQFNNSYASWHNQGSTIPYIANRGFGPNLQYKTISPSNINPSIYDFTLGKYQYEAFTLNNNLNNPNNPSVTNGIVSIFNGSWAGTSLVYSANGGYIYSDNTSADEPTQNMFMILYEDTNFNGKTRVPSNDCLPLVVTTPNSFPNPQVRSVGTISYNPTYVPVGN
jgi:hypothetical protein